MRYIVEVDHLDNFEDVGADSVAFTPTHVVFRDEDEDLVVAYRANRVLSMVPGAG